MYGNLCGSECLNHFVLTFLNCFRTNKAAITHPVNTPKSDHSGPVPQLVSAQRPSAARPSVGTNILQVVSAMVANIKTTGDVSGAFGVDRTLCLSLTG